MKFYSLFVSMAFATVAVAQSSDPFLGSWVYSAEKSPSPTITYAIKDLRSNRYALTGSSGQTTEVKADGSTQKSLSGETVSFKRLDAHTWHMERANSLMLNRTYTVSDDDTKLTLVDIFSGKEGFESKTVAQYHREGPGKSLFGHWKSFSVETQDARPPKMVLERFGNQGLSMTFLPENRRVDLLFDGKHYQEKGRDGPLDTAKSGKRLDPRLIRLDDYKNDQLAATHDLKVSDEGNTLTTTTRRPGSPTVFIDVWEKK